MATIEVPMDEPSHQQEQIPETPQAPEIPEQFRGENGELDASKILESYKQLEQKLGAPKEPERVDDPAPEVDDSGWDADEFFSQFAPEMASGQLTDESYAKIKEVTGFDKTWVDGWILGQKAIAQQQVNDVMGVVGGKASYDKMLAWGAENLTPAAQEHYAQQINAALSEGNLDAARFVAQGLAAQWKNATGESYKPIHGTPLPTGVKAFRSKEEARAFQAKALQEGSWGQDPAVEREYNERIMAAKRQGVL